MYKNGISFELSLDQLYVELSIVNDPERLEKLVRFINELELSVFIENAAKVRTQVLYVFESNKGNIFEGTQDKLHCRVDSEETILEIKPQQLKVSTEDFQIWRKKDFNPVRKRKDISVHDERLHELIKFLKSETQKLNQTYISPQISYELIGEPIKEELFDWLNDFSTKPLFRSGRDDFFKQPFFNAINGQIRLKRGKRKNSK